MADELLDIYNDDGNFIGTEKRSKAHAEGLWHQSFHCWVVGSDNKVWLQLRGKNVTNHPSELDISSAGHLQAGETPEDGIREIEEELGIKPDFNNLNYLFTLKQDSRNNGYYNREINPTYLLKTTQSLQELKMQPEEVDGVFTASVSDLLDLFEGRKTHINANGVLRNDDNSLSCEERLISEADFVKHGRDYYIKIFSAIRDFPNL